MKNNSLIQRLVRENNELKAIIKEIENHQQKTDGVSTDFAIGYTTCMFDLREKINSVRAGFNKDK